jgi:hypothetical protein
MSATSLFARATSAKRTGAAVHASLKVSLFLILAFATAGCAAAPPQQVAAADPAVRVPAAKYRPVLGGYTGLRPVEPLSWREQNERLMPQPKP